VAAGACFGFVQFEFGFLLGPEDGRYLARPAPGADPSLVIVLRTLGAPQRRLMRRQRPRQVETAEPEPVPTSRATLVRPSPFDSSDEAGGWLTELRASHERLADESRAAARDLNHLLRAHRAVTADAHGRDVSANAALAVRVGYGSGDQVANGRFADAYELPRFAKRKRRIERLSPQEHLAAILGGRERLLACEELVLRARMDIDAERPREAALQARIALECLLAELPAGGGGRRLVPDLTRDRAIVSRAGNAALEGDPPEALQTGVAASVDRMQEALRLERLGESPTPHGA